MNVSNEIDSVHLLVQDVLGHPRPGLGPGLGDAEADRDAETAAGVADQLCFGGGLALWHLGRLRPLGLLQAPSAQLYLH